MAGLAGDDRIDELVSHYEAERERVISVGLRQIEVALAGSSKLASLIHSSKSRLKDPDHLREKLKRKRDEQASKGEELDVTADNLLIKVTDLAGIRLLHLYTRQFPAIHAALTEVFDESRYSLVETPFVRLWDNDLRPIYESCGIEVQDSENYTSVHYVISTLSKTAVTCEIQVRTLSEELWGEVNHAINYPLPSPRLACREQLRALARVTSSATRLVDSIMLTHEEDPKT